MVRASTRWLALTVVATLVAAGCTSDEEPGPSGEARGERAGEVLAEPSIDDEPLALPDDLLLASFSGCADLLEHIQARALDLVGPYGLNGGGGGWRSGTVDDGDEAAADDAGAAAPEAGLDTSEVSGTNVQEAGVDEPDLVKTDGATLYTVTQERLRVLDIRGDEPVELASLEMRDAWDAQLLLAGDRLLVTSSSPMPIAFPGEVRSEPAGGGWGTTTLTLIDVGDPAQPQIVERLTLDGWTVSARLVDDVARVVVRTEAGVNLPWVYPETGGLRAERRATEANREVIRSSEVEDWLPYLIHRTADGEEREGVALPCDRVARPSVFSGLGMLSVLTVDVADGDLVPDEGAVGVLTGGNTVYASRDRLYVATTQYDDPGILRSLLPGGRREATTSIHAFDTSDPTSTDYLASGEVPGHLLSQWAMSEYEGRLRVASTDGDPWGSGADVSESYVTVLEPVGDVLATIGQVGGLGLTETIHAVRFIDDVGYVVTFRQTDPLYTVDLSDPTTPVVRGELKILGYSAYLHPVGERLLLGVGQDADEEGRLKGTQLSLFDVADLDDPRRIDTTELGEGWSEVEHDHHAFLHWPATGLTVVPYSHYSWDEETQTEDHETGAATFVADREGGIDVGPTLSHVPLLEASLEEQVPGRRIDPWELGWQAQIRRSVVVGDRLLTVSEAGTAVHDLESLEQEGWLRFES